MKKFQFLNEMTYVETHFELFEIYKYKHELTANQNWRGLVYIHGAVIGRHKHSTTKYTRTSYLRTYIHQNSYIPNTMHGQGSPGINIV